MRFKLPKWLSDLLKPHLSDVEPSRVASWTPRYKVVHSVTILDKNDNPLVLKIKPYEHGVTSIVGVNRYAYKLCINAKVVLRLTPRRNTIIPKFVLGHESEEITIKCDSYEWVDDSLKPHITSQHGE